MGQRKKRHEGGGKGRQCRHACRVRAKAVERFQVRHNRAGRDREEEEECWSETQAASTGSWSLQEREK